MTDIVIVALISAGISLFLAWLARRKDDAETSVKISTAWELLNKPLVARIEKLEHNEAIFRKRERILLDYVDYLREVLRQNNIKAEPMQELPSLDDKQDDKQ